MKRCFTNILSSSVGETARFYEQIFGMKRKFDSDWFVVLTHDAIESLEVGILMRDHKVVPDSVRKSPSGVMITFVVDDCDTIYRKAVELGAQIIEAPKDMLYGQRRMLLLDPDGTVVDVSSPVGSV